VRAARRQAVARAAWLVYPFAAVLAAWWFAADRELLGNEFVLPPPARVLDRARELGAATLREDVAVTLRTILVAFGLAAAVGVPLGVLIGRSRPVRSALGPVVSFAFPTPKIALYPAFTVIFGLGTGSKVALGFAEALFPLLVATAAGTSQVEARLMWSAESLGAGRLRALVSVVVPAALPAILTGARIAIVGATVGVFLGEMIVGSAGLGHMMAVAYRTLETRDVYIAVVAISLIGFALDRTFLAARRRLLAWSPEEQEAAAP